MSSAPKDADTEDSSLQMAQTSPADWPRTSPLPWKKGTEERGKEEEGEITFWQ